MKKTYVKHRKTLLKKTISTINNIKKELISSLGNLRNFIPAIPFDCVKKFGKGARNQTTAFFPVMPQKIYLLLRQLT